MIRYSIWAAVSTEAQAGPESVSLDEQVHRSRSAAHARGWQETSGPYIVPGASRSYYVNLSDAERDIPPLRQMLDDARRGRYDLLVIYSYDRLGDLSDMIANSLRFYGVQLYSVSQPSEPQPPAAFDPYSSDAEGIMRDVARITQRWRINDLRRKWQAGMPERTRRGLTPLRVPYGYRWTGKKSPPTLDPEQAAVILEICALYLAGRSLRSIGLTLNDRRIPTPSGLPVWDVGTLRYILTNPYYAGTVTLGKSAITRDARRGGRTVQKKTDPAQWITARGQHEPLWDAATHLRILDEMERRYTTHKKSALRYPLSGLLTCAVCRQKIHRRKDGGTHRHIVLACDTGPSHVHIRYDDIFPIVGQRLAEAVQARAVDPAPAAGAGPPSRRLLDELQSRRRRIQSGFEKQLYTADEAGERLAALDREQAAIEGSQRQRQQVTDAWIVWRTLLAADPGLLARLGDWIRTDDPAAINRLLTSIIDTILIHPDHTIEIVWRE